MTAARVDPAIVTEDVRRALAEDLNGGDLTAALIPADTSAAARIISRQQAVLCGSDWFEEVFRQLDGAVQVMWRAGDGDPIRADQTLCELAGPARSLLTGERTALNFLQTLSGTATVARRYAEAVAHTRARVLDTRKTIPGLRRAQKYAVRCGGGHNHRMGLYDGILIKENHIAAAGSLAAAIARARADAPPGIMVEVEVEAMAMLRAAIEAGADRLLLDNFNTANLSRAVAETAGRARLEASGNVTLDNIAAIAETGVDDISVGALTKHLQAVDLSLRFAGT